MRTRHVSATVLIGVAAGTLMGPRLAGLAQTSVVTQVVDLGWIRVPAGTFRMGCVESDTSCLDNERPDHEVTFLEPFDLMGAEATIAQYAQFVADSGHPAPPSPEFPQAADHPVVLVNWDDAVDFCEWAGGRRSGQRQGANSSYDMTGNVWEWVDGWLDDQYYASSPPINPPGAVTGFSRIARGGSWLNFAAALRTSVRLPFAQTGQTSNVGVRCAKGLPTARAD